MDMKTVGWERRVMRGEGRPRGLQGVVGLESLAVVLGCLALILVGCLVGASDGSTGSKAAVMAVLCVLGSLGGWWVLSRARGESGWGWLLVGRSGSRRGELEADLGHELRTPLHGVIGMLSLLRDTRLDATQSDYVDAAWNSANHLMAVLNNVVDLSRIEAGRMTLQLEPVDVGRLVRDVGGLVAAMTKAKGLGFRTRVEDAAPRWARMDGTRVRQVLFNLLSNAVKFSERGEILLVASTSVSEHGVLWLRFMVKDQGAGMDEATVASLFQRFSRGNAGQGVHAEGAGLGLQISMALARLMGGDIRVVSEPGAGSTFEFTIPCQPCSEPEVASARNGELVAAAGTLRVMVVEDHPVNRQYLAALLSRLGHEVVVCGNGAEALAAIEGGEFDLVLMDVRMPGIDGFEATRRIRARQAPGDRLPVVALTADTTAEARKRAVEVGMDDFLAKPVRPAEVAAVLERLGGRNRAHVGKNGGRHAMRAGGGSLTDPDTIADLCESMGLRGFQALVFGLCDEKGSSLGMLRQALDNGDAEAIGEAAHGVKGAALTLGLKAMAALAEEVEAGRSDGVRREAAWGRLVAVLPASREESLQVAARADKMGDAEGEATASPEEG